MSNQIEREITIDGRKYRVNTEWSAREIKHHCDIDQAKELARIEAWGLTDIADDDQPDYSHEGRGFRFMTHGRRGSSA